MAAVGVAARRKARRPLKASMRAYRDGSESRQVMDLKQNLLLNFPTNLYELLNIRHDADEKDIKKAYYHMQKICHPDVAGPEGEEMCILLNDAYDVLSDTNKRAAYNETLALTVTPKKETTIVDTELHPTWVWMPKRPKKEPVWTGVPRSRSLWDKVPPEDTGPHWHAQQFVYVDEFQCISCRNCCDVAPRTFCIDREHGRARVYAQWGNSEEYLDYAVSSCPVDCIHWVSRQELQALEYVTQKRMYDVNGELPCPMAIRQGTFQGTVDDPFTMAQNLNAHFRKQEKQSSFAAAADRFAKRIMEVFSHLSAALRKAGWGLR